MVAPSSIEVMKSFSLYSFRFLIKPTNNSNPIAIKNIGTARMVKFGTAPLASSSSGVGLSVKLLAYPNSFGKIAGTGASKRQSCITFRAEEAIGNFY